MRCPSAPWAQAEQLRFPPAKSGARFCYMRQRNRDLLKKKTTVAPLGRSFEKGFRLRKVRTVVAVTKPSKHYFVPRRRNPNRRNKAVRAHGPERLCYFLQFSRFFWLPSFLLCKVFFFFSVDTKGVGHLACWRKFVGHLACAFRRTRLALRAPRVRFARFDELGLRFARLVLGFELTVCPSPVCVRIASAEEKKKTLQRRKIKPT